MIKLLLVLGGLSTVLLFAIFQAMSSISIQVKPAVKIEKSVHQVSNSVGSCNDPDGCIPFAVPVRD